MKEISSIGGIPLVHQPTPTPEKPKPKPEVKPRVKDTAAPEFIVDKPSIKKTAKKVK